MLFKVAHNPFAIVQHDEGMGIFFLHQGLQVIDLVLGDGHHHDVHVLVGIRAGSFPFGDASSHVRGDELIDSIHLRENQNLGVDVLRMHPIHEAGTNGSIDKGIDSNLNIEHQQTDSVHRYVEQHVDSSHTGIRVGLGHADTDDIRTAGGAAASQNDSGSHTADDACHYASGQVIVEQRLGRYRNQRQTEGGHSDGNQGFNRELNSHRPIRVVEQRHVHEKVDDTGEVHSRRSGEMQHLDEEQSQQLRHSQEPAVIQAHRSNQHVDAHRIDNIT